MSDAVVTDQIVPFMIDHGAFRGRLVRLDDTVSTIVSRHNYPEPVALMLAETAVLAVVLADSLKYDGIFTLQSRSDGPISQMVVDVTSGGDVRGVAHFDEARLNAAVEKAGGIAALGDRVPALMGSGYLAFTVDQGPETDRYQGITELTGATLADCAHAYFRQSEQLETAIKMATTHADGRWRAAGLMLQRMPLPSGAQLSADDEEMVEDAWRTGVVLMGSVTNEELLAPDLPPADVLRRLFHSEGLKAYDARHPHFGCRCSRERVVTALSQFPRAELETMKTDAGVVEVSCEFCNEHYPFTDADLDAMDADKAPKQ
ncbi:Hsp33 family molecular chaperone HslO [Caenispirillum salinarum]|uniref:Hsp33 family molecular chaperone HslO n=1 Tax=Caenispirillum salinarum TaxID=859058 RepID=UPI001F028385|nr:Hsp33 family molecular chaperone HslO [Caenispirillum salinarum]